jgi:hypothetical protein
MNNIFSNAPLTPKTRLISENCYHKLTYLRLFTAQLKSVNIVHNSLKSRSNLISMLYKRVLQFFTAIPHFITAYIQNFYSKTHHNQLSHWYYCQYYHSFNLQRHLCLANYSWLWVQCNILKSHCKLKVIDL